ncbi:NAD(P)H-dependent oxidoreductase [Thioclava sp. GXIMD4216]|uniref:NADPH-dependent FMN reductase n=1 Tax=Thioclava sp. GXIMD4216 TaxID=3131929 RepID=UPI0030CD51FE
MTEPLKIGVIIGTTREGRFADVVTEWFMDKTASRSAFKFDVIDLRDHVLPHFEEAMAPAYAEPSEGAKGKWNDLLKSYDGFIVVTPEYNHSIPGVLKNAFDYAYTGWRRKPLGIVGYGPSGAMRAAEHLRVIAINFGMVPVRGAVHIAGADFFANMTERDPKAFPEHIDPTLDELLGDMEFWGNLTKPALKA